MASESIAHSGSRTNCQSYNDENATHAVIAHDLLEYRYMDDITGNLFSLFCLTRHTVLKMFVRLCESLEQSSTGTIHKDEKWRKEDKKSS